MNSFMITKSGVKTRYLVASWDTTVSIEKIKNGFKLKLAKECPQEDGELYLNIHSS
jgi:hypothetical protein